MDYKPRKGFYNLSQKPKTITKREHQRIIGLQKWLIEIESKKEYYIENDIQSFVIAQEASAQLGLIITKHWNLLENDVGANDCKKEYQLSLF